MATTFYFLLRRSLIVVLKIPAQATLESFYQCDAWGYSLCL